MGVGGGSLLSILFLLLGHKLTCPSQKDLFLKIQKLWAGAQRLETSLQGSVDEPSRAHPPLRLSRGLWGGPGLLKTVLRA